MRKKVARAAHMLVNAFPSAKSCFRIFKDFTLEDLEWDFVLYFYIINNYSFLTR